MKDFNFFSPYLLERRLKRLKKLYITAVSTLIILGVASFIYLTNYQIEKYTQEIASVESYLASQKTKDLLSSYEATKSKMDLTSSYYNKVAAVDKVLNKSNTVNTELLDKLASIMPQDAIMLEFNMSRKALNMKYSVYDMISVADIEHNLRTLDIFKTVHVSFIKNEFGSFADINCVLKDVNN